MKAVSEKSGVLLFLDSMECGLVTAKLMADLSTEGMARAIFNAHMSEGDGNVFDSKAEDEG